MFNRINIFTLIFLLSAVSAYSKNKAETKSFEFIKKSLGSGIVNENYCIEGIIVSDKNNPNIATNRKRVTTKALDNTENETTVYLQSIDGKYGLALKTKSAKDNVFSRFERVKISLKGLRVEQFANPARTIIYNVRSSDIIERNPGNKIIPKDLYIKDITDDDIYTYAKLKDVEISVPFGCFTNINEGYVISKRIDVYPVNIRDINGDNIYMPINSRVPYRREGNPLPQGAGYICGVITHEYLLPYGGDIGKYSIRPLLRDEIALKEDREDGFSKVLVEWSRYKKEFEESASSVQHPLRPDMGSGSLYHSKMKVYGKEIEGIEDYNGLVKEGRGNVDNGSWGARFWWDFVKEQGESWIIQTTTAGIVNSLSLQIEAHNNIGAPRNWIVEWSTDIDGVWNYIADYSLQDLVSWNKTLDTQIPGFKTFDFKLPDEILGHSRVYIRLRVKNYQAGNADCMIGGVVTNNNFSKLSHASIKFNK